MNTQYKICNAIFLNFRLELFELVKACQDSRTIHEEQQEKNGSEDPEEDVIRCSLSAEELLNAIWQDETGNVEAKENNQEESQEEWNEGFDDDDIEEVRMFQTQAVCKRTCSEETLQEPLEGILNLDDENEEMKTDNMGTLNDTTTDAVDSDDNVLVMQVDDGINGRGQSQQNEESKEERTVPKATEVIHLKTAVLGSCLEEIENENWGAKKLGDEKDDVVHSYSKDGRDDKRRDSTYDDQERDVGKRDTNDDQERDSNCSDIESDEYDKLNEKEQGPTSDIQMTGIMSYDVDDDNNKHGDVDDGNIDVVDDGNDNNMDHQSVSGKVDLTEDEDDGQDNDDENHGPDHDNNMNAHSLKDKVDLTEDEDDDHNGDDDDDGREAGRVTKQNSRLKGDHCKSIDDESDENDKYRSLEDESEEEYRGEDITILDQSISLLSDNNDCESLEKVPVSI